LTTSSRPERRAIEQLGALIRRFDYERQLMEQKKAA